MYMQGQAAEAEGQVVFSQTVSSSSQAAVAAVATVPGLTIRQVDLQALGLAPTLPIIKRPSLGPPQTLAETAELFLESAGPGGPSEQDSTVERAVSAHLSEGGRQGRVRWLLANPPASRLLAVVPPEQRVHRGKQLQGLNQLHGSSAPTIPERGATLIKKKDHFITVNDGSYVFYRASHLLRHKELLFRR
jgi:hypothetical protein